MRVLSIDPGPQERCKYYHTFGRFPVTFFQGPELGVSRWSPGTGCRASVRLVCGCFRNTSPSQVAEMFRVK